MTTLAPLFSTAQKMPRAGEYAIEAQLFAAGEATRFQLIPSRERATALFPTATNIPLPQATEFQAATPAVGAAFQVIPSRDHIILFVPVAATPTKIFSSGE